MKVRANESRASNSFESYAECSRGCRNWKPCQWACNGNACISCVPNRQVPYSALLTIKGEGWTINDYAGHWPVTCSLSWPSSWAGREPNRLPLIKATGHNILQIAIRCMCRFCPYVQRCYGRTCRECLVVRPRELWTTGNEKWKELNEIWGKWTVDEREWMSWLAIGYVYTWTDYFIQRAVKWNVVENTLPCASAAVFYQSALKYII